MGNQFVRIRLCGALQKRAGSNVLEKAEAYGCGTANPGIGVGYTASQQWIGVRTAQLADGAENLVANNWRLDIVSSLQQRGNARVAKKGEGADGLEPDGVCWIVEEGQEKGGVLAGADEAYGHGGSCADGWLRILQGLPQLNQRFGSLWALLPQTANRLSPFLAVRAVEPSQELAALDAAVIFTRFCCPLRRCSIG